MLADTPWLVTAANRIREMGPKVIVIKKGEHGALGFLADGTIFHAPALPLEKVVDPTGAGDTFASGLFGYLARVGASVNDHDAIRKGIVYGSAMASFTVEDFGLRRLQKLTIAEVEERVELFRRLTKF